MNLSTASLKVSKLAHMFMLIINKHFNFCWFEALAYTTLDTLCAVSVYNISCFNKVC